MSPRALIVDDNATARNVIREIVESMGWHSECVASGEEALARLDQTDAEPLQIILIDWQMKGLDGWETTRRIRQHQSQKAPLRRDAPIVIMVSSSGQSSFAQRSRREVELLDGYLVKPITASMVYDSVVDAMASREEGSKSAKKVETTHRLAGLRLLVVEDNLLNQQVALELLSHSGALVEIAGGGRSGVDHALAADPPFDAILMDMQMPDIDGLEATRRILSHAFMRLVPIIAMTANAMEADKEACREAGMVDHVSKPIDLEQLINAILIHTGRSGPDGVVMTGPAVLSVSAPESALSPATLPLLDVEGALVRLGGRREFYDKVVVSFVGDASEQWQSLKAGLAQGDWTAAARSAHTLKGLSGTVGAMRLAQQVADLEHQLNALLGVAGLTTGPRQAPPAEVAEAVDRVAVVMEQVLAELAGLVPAPKDDTQESNVQGVDERSSSDKSALVEDLAELQMLLQNRNMRAMTLWAQIVQNHANALPTALQQRVSELDKLINRLDFGLAFAHCAELLGVIQNGPAS